MDINKTLVEQGSCLTQVANFNNSCSGGTRAVRNAQFNNTNIYIVYGSEMDEHLPVNLDRENFRSLKFTGFDITHEWDKKALRELTGKNIIAVEPKSYVANKIGDIMYQQRLNSFYTDGNPDNKQTVHEIFSTPRFNPETLATYGWSRQLPECENFEQVLKMSEGSEYYKNIKARDDYGESLLRVMTAKDRIAVHISKDHEPVSLFGFEDNESFPDGLDTGSPTTNDAVYQNVQSVLEVQESPVFCQNDGKKCNAEVVKLTGRNIYLITPEENKDMLQFGCLELPDSSFPNCYLDSWKKYIDDTGCREMDQHTLQRLEEILEYDPNLSNINHIIEMLEEQLRDETFKEESSVKLNIQKLKDKLVELKSLYKNVLVTKKEMQFYQVKKDKVLEDIDFMMESDIWLTGNYSPATSSKGATLSNIRTGNTEREKFIMLDCAELNQINLKIEGLSSNLKKNISEIHSRKMKCELLVNLMVDIKGLLLIPKGYRGIDKKDNPNVELSIWIHGYRTSLCSGLELPLFEWKILAIQPTRI